MAPVFKSLWQPKLSLERLDQTDVRNRLKKEANRLGGVQSSRLWDRYFECYDRIVPYSDGYRGLVENACGWLPKSGTIADIGCGTGNFSVALGTRSRGRGIIGVDQSEGGLKSARRKIESLKPSDRARFSFRHLDLKSIQSPKPCKLDGAVLNNVLYSLPKKSRPVLLKHVATLLKPEGRFSLNDPVAEIQGSQKTLRRFLSEVCQSALNNGAPATEEEILFLVYLNERNLVAGSPQFFSQEELATLVEDCGFEIVKYRRAYFDACHSLELRKKRP